MNDDFDNWCGDNLAPTDDDEQDDENECLNWTNNPIRKLFDNPVSRFHRTYLDDIEEEDDE